MSTLERRAPIRYYVYRLKNADEKVIYVGCTNDPLERLRRHRTRPWGDEIATVELIPQYTAPAATEMEKAEILRLSPVYNRSVPGMPLEQGRGLRIAQVIEVLRECGPMTDGQIKRALTERGIDGAKNFVGWAVRRCLQTGEVAVVGERPINGGPAMARVFGAVS